MKLIFAILFSLSIGTGTHAQELTGEWKGYYTNEAFGYAVSPGKTNISLTISMNSDSSYSIFSFSNLKDFYRKDSIVKCKVIYKMTGKNSFRFEEVNDDTTMTDRGQFQIMYLVLKQKKNRLLLDGEWKSNNKQDISKGLIRFERVSK